MTAITPGARSAAAVSRPLMRPDAILLCSNTPWAPRGAENSDAYFAPPVTLSRPSTRSIGAPTFFLASAAAPGAAPSDSATSTNTGSACSGAAARKKPSKRSLMKGFADCASRGRLSWPLRPPLVQLDKGADDGAFGELYLERIVF